MPIMKEQAAHLNQRITTRHGEIRYRKRDPQPAAVTKASALVAAWEEDQRNKADEHARKVGSARTVAQEAVLTGDWPSALAAVKKFETTKF